MKKRTFLLLPLLIAALTGCGGGEPAEDSSTPASASPSSGAPISTPSGGSKVKISFWHTFGQKPEAALKSKVSKFVELIKQNENVDVEVECSYQGAYKDMPRKVTTAIATGDQPTIAIAYPDHVADYLALEGNQPGKYVVNLDTYLNDPALTFGTDA